MRPEATLVCEPSALTRVMSVTLTMAFWPPISQSAVSLVDPSFFYKLVKGQSIADPADPPFNLCPGRVEPGTAEAAEYIGINLVLALGNRISLARQGDRDQCTVANGKEGRISLDDVGHIGIPGGLRYRRT